MISISFSDFSVRIALPASKCCNIRSDLSSLAFALRFDFSKDWNYVCSNYVTGIRTYKCYWETFV